MKVVTIPCAFDNYAYLLICEETGEAGVIDPAEFYPVFREVEEQGVHLQSVFCTHHHADHIGGIEDLLDEFPTMAVYGHELDRKRIPGLNGCLNHGEMVRVGNTTGETIHTPGHTTGSVCYFFNNVLFTGDTLFGAGCGRLFEGSPRQMFEALNVVSTKFPPETEVYFGHEYTQQNLKFARFVDPDNQAVMNRQTLAVQQIESGKFTTPSTLRLEAETNPFMRCSEQGLIRTVVEKNGDKKPDSLSVFTALRRLKDSF